jgi:putative endonuclease
MEKDLIQSIDLCRFGEEEACRFLKKKGLKILERNYAIRAGEIDVVARAGKTMVFIEVKTRSSSALAKPYEAVGFRKRKKLKSAARMYIQERNLRNLEYRFDVISIIINSSLQPEIEWLQGAF